MPKYQYLIKHNNNSFSDAIIIALEPKTPKDIFGFIPGQYAMLSFYDSAGRLFINHPFSIASSPTDDDLVFGIRVMGRFTQTLSKLPVGTQIDVLAPFGDFVFEEDKYPEVVFIAGGVGITPFISASRYATLKGLKNKITLLYSTRNLKDALFYEDIKHMASVNPNFSTKIAISNEAVPEGTLFCENCRISKELISTSVDSVANKDFFLCGPAPFMKAMEENLAALGVSKNKIHQEAFSVVPNLSFKNNFKNIFLVYGFSLALFIATLIFVSGGFDVKETVIQEAPKKSSVNLIENTASSSSDIISEPKQVVSETVTKTVIEQKTITNIPAVDTTLTKKPKVTPIATPVVTTPTPVVSTPIVTPTTVPTTPTAPVVSVPVVVTPVTPVVDTPIPVPTPRTRLS